MKAYKVRTRYAAHYEHPVEEIEVDRMTEKSYYQGPRMSRRETEYEMVFATREGAIKHAKRMTLGEITRVESELGKLQARLAKIEAMEGGDSTFEDQESVKQMQQAPQNAVYFWRNTEFLEATRLAVTAGRDDLEIYGIDGLNNSEMFCGQRLSGVVVDHAAKLTDEQKRNHDWLLCRIAPKEVAP